MNDIERTESTDAPIDVAIVGAGPAGAGLAFLLARQGLSVHLLERRTDFAREFRGEVLMPSGVDALRQMGLEASMLALPGCEQVAAEIFFNGTPIIQTEFSELATPAPIRAVSQAALLEMLVTNAAEYPGFTLVRGAGVKEVMRNAGGRVCGIRYRKEGETRELRARLVIGADGRHSVIRRQLDVAQREASPPMDIVWCKVPLPEGWQGVRGYVGKGHLLVAYHTWGDQLQLGWVILKGTFRHLRNQGVEAWVSEMANHASAPLADHLKAQTTFIEKPFLLDVASDCVEQWSVPGALLIGDAAHTMSPVGGQGLNLALRDAIVTANHLGPLFGGPQDAAHLHLDEALRAIEQERMAEVGPIQALQAAPPRLVLSHRWWGEPLRWLAFTLLKTRLVRSIAGRRVAQMLFGAVPVRLDV